jgi:hypothetical protein
VTFGETSQRCIELAELGVCGVRDRAEDVVVLSLSRLFGKIGAQRIGLVPQVGARPARPDAKLVPAFKQLCAYPF